VLQSYNLVVQYKLVITVLKYNCFRLSTRIYSNYAGFDVANERIQC